MWGSGMYCQALPYKEGFGQKQIAWMVHAGIVGAVIAPITMLGGPIMVKAAVYTAGMVAGEYAQSRCDLWLLRHVCMLLEEILSDLCVKIFF